MNHRVDALLQEAARAAKHKQLAPRDPLRESRKEAQARHERQRREHARLVEDNLRLIDLALRDPIEAAREAGRICPHCHEPLLPEVVPCPLPWDKDHRHVVFPDRCGCPGEAAALAQQAQKEKAQADCALLETRMTILEKAGLLGQLETATFSTFQPRIDWPGAVGAKASAEAYCQTMLSGGLGAKPFLLLCGEVGCGKTHLAAAIAHEALAAGWRGIYLRSWAAYLKRIQATWDKRKSDTLWETEQDVLDELSKGRLVVIDDVDKKTPVPWSRETLYTPINTRLIAGAPTILTFNCALDTPDPNAPARLALEDVLGIAVLDRIIGAAWAVVLFNGPSYRSGVKWNNRR